MEKILKPTFEIPWIKKEKPVQSTCWETWAVTVHAYDTKVSFYKQGSGRYENSYPYFEQIGGESHQPACWVGKMSLELAQAIGKELWKKFPGTFRTIQIWNNKRIIFKSDNFKQIQK